MPKLSESRIKSLRKQRAKGISVVEIAKKENLTYNQVYYHTGLLDLALSQGYASQREYVNYQIRQKINPETGKKYASRSEYDEDLAKRRGFKSKSKYQEYLAKIKQNKKQNKELSDLIREKLKKTGKDQKDLAEEIGVSRQMVSIYLQGKSIPKNDILKKLSKAIEVPYKILEDILEED
nr:helix-turn-helix domain-containing protein [Candidatus Woesearchaeota archaeon]